MSDDWRDLLAALHAAGVRYLVIGAHALAVHGVPRGTQDLDLWIDATPENAERVWNALVAFGAPLSSFEITVADFARRGMVIQLGLPPNRIDLLTSITGVDNFAAAWASRVTHELEGIPTAFISRPLLITNKRATGRRKDLSDLEALGALPPKF